MAVTEQCKRILAEWERWVDYREKATRDYKYYDMKRENAGSNNWQRYSYGYDMAVYGYSPVKDGWPWCATTGCFSIITTEGYEEADRLLCGVLSTKGGAGCTQIHQAFAAQGRWHKSNPQIGDLVTFGDDDHIGIVYNVENGYIYTMEGNTKQSSGVEADGGGLFKKSYPIGSSYINGYCRPDYKEDEEVTQEQFNAMMEVYISQRNAKNQSKWSKEEGGFDYLCNTISPVNGKALLDGTAPYGYITREQVGALLYRMGILQEE